MLLFHTCFAVALPSVDLGFNWIGGLGSLRISLFSLFRLLHRHDLEIIEISENGPGNFVSIISLSDDRSAITPSVSLEHAQCREVLSSTDTIFMICCEKLSYLISVK